MTSAATRDSELAPPRLNGVTRGGGPLRGTVAWVVAQPPCGRAAENFGGVAPQLTRSWCPQPALRVDRGGVTRSATFCCGHVTVHARPHPQKWALLWGSQAGPRSTKIWARGRHRIWQHDLGICQMSFLWEGGRGATDRRSVPATSGASIVPSSSEGARLWRRRHRRRPSCFPDLPVASAGAAGVRGRERPS